MFSSHGKADTFSFGQVAAIYYLLPLSLHGKLTASSPVDRRTQSIYLKIEPVRRRRTNVYVCSVRNIEDKHTHTHIHVCTFALFSTPLPRLTLAGAQHPPHSLPSLSGTSSSTSLLYRVSCRSGVQQFTLCTYGSVVLCRASRASLRTKHRLELDRVWCMPAVGGPIGR